MPKVEPTTSEEPKEVKKDDVKPVEEGMEKLNVEESKQDVIEEKAVDIEEKCVYFLIYGFELFPTFKMFSILVVLV